MRRRRLATIALLAAPALAAAGVRPTWGGTVRIAVPSAPRGTDASGDPADLVVQRAISAPLLELDAKGRLRPAALAEVPVPEADGRSFRLRLRPDLADPAGRRIGASELAARLSALLEGTPASANAFVALPIDGADAVLEGRARALAGVRVLSATELLVTLAFPLPQFPLLLATAPAGLPGAGPFTIEGTPAPGAPLRLVRNDRCLAGRPFADAVELRAHDARLAARLLEKGEVDLVLRPEPAGARGASLPALTVTVAVVNADRLGAGAEPLRRTLAAIDRAELARRFVRGSAEPLATLVPPALLRGAPAPAPPARPAAAGPPQRIVLLADASAADQRALAERIQVKLFDRGVRAAIDLVQGEPRLRARLAARDWDAALVSVTVLAPDPALAAGQVAWATRGATAARRVTAELARTADAAVLGAALDRIARELGIVPLVASGLRASAAATLEGLSTRPDATIDVAGLWRLGAPP